MKRIARVHADVAPPSPIELVIRPFASLNAATKLVVVVGTSVSTHALSDAMLAGVARSSFVLPRAVLAVAANETQPT